MISICIPTYVLLSLTHFFKQTKWFRIAVSHKLFSEFNVKLKQRKIATKTVVQVRLINLENLLIDNTP